MGAPFLYWRLRVPTGGMPDARALHESAVRPWAVFTSQIGTPADEVVAITPGQQADVDAGVTSRLVVAGVEPIAATVRPLTSEPLTLFAVYAHRWFDIAEKDWPEFLSLSEGAWPGFEMANSGVRIEGFFRSEAVTSPDARVLLVTRYPSLAAWEQSRNATDEAGGANFRRRHEITRKTVVATFRLLAP